MDPKPYLATDDLEKLQKGPMTEIFKILSVTLEYKWNRERMDACEHECKSDDDYSSSEIIIRG